MANGWTAERKAKQSQAIQGWKPWDKSTGAKTPEGKVVSSKNAFKGGFKSLLKEINVFLREHREVLKQFD